MCVCMNVCDQVRLLTKAQPMHIVYLLSYLSVDCSYTVCVYLFCVCVCVQEVCVRRQIRDRAMHTCLLVLNR